MPLDEGYGLEDDGLYDSLEPRATETALVTNAALGSAEMFDNDLVAAQGRASELAITADFARGARGAIGVLTGLDEAVYRER